VMISSNFPWSVGRMVKGGSRAALLTPPCVSVWLSFLTPLVLDEF